MSTESTITPRTLTLSLTSPLPTGCSGQDAVFLESPGTSGDAENRVPARSLRARQERLP
jgi:hypothetical protein